MEPVTNFFDLIHENLQQHPDDELIVWPEPDATARSYTGRAILDRISVLRNELVEQNVQPGQQVLLAMPVTVDLICSLLAVMALGAIPVLPPAGSTPRTLLWLAIWGKSRAMMTQRKLSRPVAWLLSAFSIKSVCTDGIFPSNPAWLPPQPVNPDQPALISHSSGSTGRAKAIRRSHRVLRAQHQALNVAFLPWSRQRDFPLFPNVLLHNLATGTVSILPDLPGFRLLQMDPARIAQQLISQRIQTITGNVHYFRELLVYFATHSLCFPDVRAVGIGGSPVPEWLVQSLKRVFVGADVYIIYGSSEAEPIAIRKIGTERWNPRFGYGVGSVHPAIQVQIRPIGTLTFPNGTTQTAGEIGVRGAHVATDGDGWLWTGDFGYFDKNNQLVLTGRRGNEQIRMGVQHYQIEHVLSTVPGVKHVAARATDAGFTVYVAGTPAEVDLQQALTDHFPPGLVNHIYFRTELPLDARHHSKIRYDALA